MSSSSPTNFLLLEISFLMSTAVVTLKCEVEFCVIDTDEWSDAHSITPSVLIADISTLGTKSVRLYSESHTCQFLSDLYSEVPIFGQ